MFPVFLPANSYRVESKFRRILAVAQHTDEVVLLHHHDQVGHAFGSRGIYLLETGAVRRGAEDFAVKHTVDNNILRVLGLPGDPVQRIGARCIPAHEEKALGVLDGRVFGNGKPEILALQKVGEADSLA